MLLAVPALVVLAAVPLGALPGRSLLPVSFERARSRVPKPPGAAPAGDEASKTGPKPRVDHLALACADHDQVDEPAIACRWSKAERKEFASYRLLRSRNADPDDRIVVFHTKDRDKTAFVDETIRPNVTYTYRVEALDDSEKVIARSKDVKATDRSPEPDHVRLACRDADAPKPGPKAAPSDKDAEAIACRWTKSRRPSFASYRLVRSKAGDPGPLTTVFETNDRDTTSYLDGTAAPDTAYDYVLEVLNSNKDVIDRSNVSRAGDEDEHPEGPRLACYDPDPRPQPTAGPAAQADTEGQGAEPSRPFLVGEEEKIVCRWSRSERPEFGSYRLIRSVPGTAQPPVIVFQSDDRGETSFTDTRTTEAVIYQYVLDVLNNDGKVVATSEPARAGGGEGPGPQQPGKPQPSPQQPQPSPQQPQLGPQAGAGKTSQGGAGDGSRARPRGGRDRRP